MSVKHLVYLRLSVSQCCHTAINPAAFTNLADERDVDGCKHCIGYASTSISDSESHSHSRTSLSRNSLEPLDLRNNNSQSLADESLSTNGAEEIPSSKIFPQSSNPDSKSGYSCTEPLLSRTRPPCPESTYTFRAALETEFGKTCLCKAFESIQRHAGALSQSHDYVYVCGEPGACNNTVCWVRECIVSRWTSVLEIPQKLS